VTLIGAGVYSLYQERALLSLADAPMFLVGLVVSFISAWLCIPSALVISGIFAISASLMDQAT